MCTAASEGFTEGPVLPLGETFAHATTLDSDPHPDRARVCGRIRVPTEGISPPVGPQ